MIHRSMSRRSDGREIGLLVVLGVVFFFSLPSAAEASADPVPSVPVQLGARVFELSNESGTLNVRRLGAETPEPWGRCGGPTAHMELFAAGVNDATTSFGLFSLDGRKVELRRLTIPALPGAVQCPTVAAFEYDAIRKVQRLREDMWLILGGKPLIVSHERRCEALVPGIDANDNAVAVKGDEVAFARPFRTYHVPADPCAEWRPLQTLKLSERVQQIAAVHGGWVFLTQRRDGRERVLIVSSDLHHGRAFDLPAGQAWLLVQRASTAILMSQPPSAATFRIDEGGLRRLLWPPHAGGELVAGSDDATAALYDGRNAYFSVTDGALPMYEVVIVSLGTRGIVLTPREMRTGTSIVFFGFAVVVFSLYFIVRKRLRRERRRDRYTE